METTVINSIMINTAALRAAIHCTADKNDMREILRNVYVKFANPNRATVAGCDGCVIFVGLADIEPTDDRASIDAFTAGAWVGQSVLIPVDAIKALDKRAAMVKLSKNPDNTYTLGNTIFTPYADRNYPDIARVIPTTEALDCEPKPATYSVALLTKAHKALQAYFGTKPSDQFNLAQYGDNAGVMYHVETDAQVVIMPMRTQSAPVAFNRDYL